MDITTSADVHRVRREAELLADSVALESERTNEVSIVASELASNIDHHATEGGVLLRELAPPGGPGVELVSMDRGPGMEEPSRCMQDGYSTRGTAGTGLGAIKRLSTRFGLSSSARGTIVVSQLAGEAAVPILDVGAAYRPRPGEWACGDGWIANSGGSCFRALLVDGLGHGPEAEEATFRALRAFDAEVPLERLVARLHEALRGSRGAAAAAVDVERASGAVSYVSVGNVAAWLVAPSFETRPLLSHAGTLGAQIRCYDVSRYDLAVGGWLILHTDGVHHRWGGHAFRGAALPSLGAAQLIRDAGRDRDDAAVLAVRREGSG